MNKLKWLLAPIICIYACGTDVPDVRYEPDFNDYIEEFKVNCDYTSHNKCDFSKLKKISWVSYKSISGSAECEFGDDWNEIRVANKMFNKSSNSASNWDNNLLRMTLFHELAHCTLNKQHDAKGSGTIMSVAPYINPNVIGVCWNYLVDDLFMRNHATTSENILNLPNPVKYDGGIWFSDKEDTKYIDIRKTCYK
jgi:hypothetical protein